MNAEHPNISRIRRALKMEGGFYDFEDIMVALEAGQMQSFAEGESVIFTRVNMFPRRKVLELVLMVGVAEELQSMEPRLIEFAKQYGCDGMMGSGRLGWEAFMTDGWRKVVSTYVKDFAK